MVGKQMTFLNATFLLLGQLPKYLALMLPQTPIQHLPAALRN
jgi:hypothetical protein